MSDPFDGVTPIGSTGRGRDVSGLSPREKHMRAKADHSEAPAPATLTSTDPATNTPREPGKRRRKALTSTMTVDELKGMAERLLRRAYKTAMTPDEIVTVDDAGVKKRTKTGVKEFERKHATASFGIAVDKLQMLAGRPTQIHEHRGAERPGLKSLARRVLGGGA